MAMAPGVSWNLLRAEDAVPKLINHLSLGANLPANPTAFSEGWGLKAEVRREGLFEDLGRQGVASGRDG